MCDLALILKVSRGRTYRKSIKIKRLWTQFNYCKYLMPFVWRLFHVMAFGVSLLRSELFRCTYEISCEHSFAICLRVCVRLASPSR